MAEEHAAPEVTDQTPSPPATHERRHAPAAPSFPASPRMVEATRPDVPSPASEQKADTSAWPEDFKRYMDRMAVGGQRMTRFGKRFEIHFSVDAGVFVTNIEDAQPKIVHFLSHPQPDEYMPGDEEPAKE